MLDDRIVFANGVSLCVQTFGDPADPALLLVMGSGASMDWWEDELCERLAAGGRRVVRYDHRDTGRSVSYPPGAPGYDFTDLVEDAVGVLDALGIPRAHVAGMSMGGAIAQVLALDHPGRVASLTLISTSPAGPHEPDLPPMEDPVFAAFVDVPGPDWDDRSDVVDYLTFLARACASRSRPFDDSAIRDLWEQVIDRTRDIEASAKNHGAMPPGPEWRERLDELEDVPTLVLHGTEDPFLPYGHALALADEIPGAWLVPLENSGHELPPRTWDVVIPALLAHTAGPQRASARPSA